MESTFAERLKQALKIRNMSAAELSRRSDTPESVISQYKKGEYEAKQRRVERFSKILMVSIPWLMGHDVPMEYNLTEEQKNTPNAKASEVSDMDKELLSIISDLSDTDKIKLEEYVDFLKSKHVE